MRRLALLLAASALLAGSIGHAADGPAREKHKFRVGFTVASSTGEFSTTDRFESFFTTTTVSSSGEGGSAIGFRLGYEYRPISRLGIALDVERARVDIAYREVLATETISFFGDTIRDSISGNPEGDLQITPITLGLNVYLSTGPRHDLYVGPAVGYVLYGRLRQDAWRGLVESSGDSVFVEDASSIGLDNGSSAGAVAGLDLRLASSRASFHVSVAYLASAADGDESARGFTMDVDPVLVRLGTVFRF